MRRGAYEITMISTLLHELHHIYVFHNKLEKDEKGLTHHENAQACGALLNGKNPVGTCYFLELKEVQKHSK